jgi:chemotaxis regulatin CheY-phosphate phosphatase CheZ
MVSFLGLEEINDICRKMMYTETMDRLQSKLQKCVIKQDRQQTYIAILRHVCETITAVEKQLIIL